MAVSPGKADRRQSMPDVSLYRRDSGPNSSGANNQKKKGLINSIVNFFQPGKKEKGPNGEDIIVPDHGIPHMHSDGTARRQSNAMMSNPNITPINTDPMIPGLIDKYSWGPKIGAGAFSTVREVYVKNAAENDDRIRAVKLVRISARAVEEDEEEQEARERHRELVQQGKAVGKLPPRRQSAMTPNEIEEETTLLRVVQHQNIVQMHEVYNHGEWCYIVMDKYEGDVEAARPQDWSFSRLSFVAAQLCLALFHLHSHDVCHRDLKPQNVFLRSFPQWRYPLAVISDFGLAARCSEEYNGLTATSGSLFYLAPEVLQRRYGRRADVWSLGVCFYWMLYGSMPFTGRDDAALARAIQAGTTKFPSLEGESSPAAKRLAELAVDFVKQLLVSNPKRRLSSYSLLKHPFIRPSLAELPWAYETIRAGKERLAQNDRMFNRAVCADMGITTVAAAVNDRGRYQQVPVADVPLKGQQQSSQNNATQEYAPPPTRDPRMANAAPSSSNPHNYGSPQPYSNGRTLAAPAAPAYGHSSASPQHGGYTHHHQGSSQLQSTSSPIPSSQGVLQGNGNEQFMTPEQQDAMRKAMQGRRASLPYN